MLEMPPSIQPARAVKRYAGRVIYIYAFDVAYEMLRAPVPQLLGQPVAQFSVDASRRNPRHLFFYRPQMVRLPPMERIGPYGPVRIERSLKLLAGRRVEHHGVRAFCRAIHRGIGGVSRSGIFQRPIDPGSAADRRGSARGTGPLLHQAGGAIGGGGGLHRFLY